MITIGRSQRSERRVEAVTKPSVSAVPIDLTGVPLTSGTAVPTPVPHTRAARHWIHEHRVHVPHVSLGHVHMPHVPHAHLPHLPPVKPEKSLRHYQFLESALMSREMDRL